MNVLCVSFGSMWHRKIHDDGTWAWFNTTGVTRTPVSRHLLRLWTFSGVVRFNILAFPWASSPKDLVGVLCSSPGIEKISGDTRLLCAGPVKRSEPLDSLLVCIRPYDIGFIDRQVPWRSQGVRLIAASGHRDGRQEFLLLVKPGSWVRSESGFWELGVAYGPNHRPKLNYVFLGATEPI